MKEFRKTILLGIVMGVIIYSVGYIWNSGLLKPFPKEDFLTAEEAECRPVYRELSKKEKAVYAALYRGVSEHKRSIELPCDIKGAAYEKVYEYFQKQESAFFYLSADFLTADRIRAAKMTYICDKEEIDEKVNELEKVRDMALSELEDYMSDYEKACCIHDFIAKNCTYTVEGGDDEGSAYGCLVGKKARCEGYAKAFDYLLKAAGINDVVITGETDDGAPHAWNKFESGGTWYNVDVTWDDNDSECEDRHIFFMSSKGGFNSSHYPEKRYKSKKFVFNKYEYDDAKRNYYYLRKGFYVDSYDKIDEILMNGVDLYNQKGFIEMQFEKQSVISDFKTEYFVNGRIWELIRTNNPYFLSSIDYESFEYIENDDENCVVIYLD